MRAKAKDAVIFSVTNDTIKQIAPFVSMGGRATVSAIYSKEVSRAIALSPEPGHHPRGSRLRHPFWIECQAFMTLPVGSSIRHFSLAMLDSNL
jgi:hypothetical protein